MNAIELTNVTKVYRRYARRKQFATLKSALLSGSLIHDLQPDETFPALKGVSFTVPAGRTYGIIGRNGSGKSTALKLVAGITKPTTGTVKVEGRISALIELGAGFHPEISGRENVFINGIMLGLTKREVARRFDEIVEFAELQDFIDAPVKTYSSGMYMRLGFAVAIHVDPDVLLVDEVLAVGDEGFTHKCLDKFGEFKRRGKTILLVTHSLNLVERFCDEALWLDGGKVRGSGDPKRVVGAYLTDVGKSEERELARAEARSEQRAESQEPADPGAEPQSGSVVEDMTRVDEGRWGSREIEITGVTFKNESGEVSHIFQSGDPMSIHIAVRAHQATADFVFGIGLYSAEGVNCYGTNTHLEEFTPQELRGEGEVTFSIESLELVEGTYKLDVAVHKRDGYPYDYHRLLYTFRVKSRSKEVGIYRPRHTWAFSQSIRTQKREVVTKNAKRTMEERHFVSSFFMRKVLSIPEAQDFVTRYRQAHRTVVFTNGVFDLLHPGHVRYLKDARREGDALIVAVNSDRSVRAIKGPMRPVNPEGERAEVVAALACVDAVVIFDEETPQQIISRLQPDVLAKGADWAMDAIVGRETVEQRGGRVVRIPLAEGYSTSAIIKKIQGL